MNNWAIVTYLHGKILASGELEGASKPTRQARLFAHALAQLPIRILPGESLAGDFGWICLDNQAREGLEKEITHAGFSYSPLPPHSPGGTAMRDAFHCFGEYSLAHTCLDYGRLVERGLGGYLEDIRSKLPAANEEEADYLHAMEIALHAVVSWAARYADLADKLAETAATPNDKRRWTTISRHCHHVPLNPARSFAEALQSIWLLHAAVGISEHSDASLSLGRLDQYLLPLYRQDLASGKTEAELETRLIDLHLKLNRYGDAACALNLGGLDANGNDLFNPLSAMIVRVAKRLQMPAPILAARIHPETPQEVLDSLIDPKLATIGQPTFYGEHPCRETMIRRGVPKAAAFNWTANSCMGLMMAGEEVSNMWGAVANMLLPLELALNSGKPFVADLPIPIAEYPRKTFASFAELTEAYWHYLREILAFCLDENRERTRWAAEESPNPYLSALLADCIATGRDRANGGARYHIAIVESFALVNLAEALLAIRQLVFEQKQFSLEEMLTAAKSDFVGFPKLYKAIQAVPKYGNDQPVIDKLVAQLAKKFAGLIGTFNTDVIRYAPSFHTLTAHIVAGAKTAASLDGRHAGAPIAKNIGSSPGRAKKGQTALLKSITAIDQKEFFGGQAIDLSFDAKALTKRSDKRKIQSLLQTYFRLGGLQVQLNAVSPERLQQAIDDPAGNADVIVRIAGYSRHFVDLDPATQKEMVARLTVGM